MCVRQSDQFSAVRRVRYGVTLGLLLLAETFLGTQVRSDDVEWLRRVTASVDVSADATHGRLAPVLVTSTGQTVTGKSQWLDQRRRLREEWEKFLGVIQASRPVARFDVLSTETLSGVIRQKIRYEGESGEFVQAWLLTPESSETASSSPGIVALHQTTNATIDEIAGVSGPDDMQIGFKLAKQGFVVICPRCFLWQDVTSLNEAVARHQAKHPSTLGMAKMLYDAMRATDILLSVTAVDPKRVGATGHSLGAKEVLYLAAFDERIRAAVASEGGLSFRSTNWDAPWYLGESIRDADFPLNHHQLLALIAPRPFLVLGGETGPGAADGNRSWPVINAALPVWELYGEPVRLGLLNHGEGHSLSPKSFEALSEWLRIYLKPK